MSPERFKPMQRWWDEAHGGEWQGHCDFAMTEGETFGEALKQILEEAEDTYWQKPVPKGKKFRCHFRLNVFEGEDKEMK